MDSILFIAPQKEIAQVARKVFQDLNISIPIIIAKNEAAVSQARKYPNISVIVSRGGTARDLKKYTDKLIVDVNISFSDISSQRKPPLHGLAVRQAFRRCNTKG